MHSDWFAVACVSSALVALRVDQETWGVGVSRRQLRLVVLHNRLLVWRCGGGDGEVRSGKGLYGDGLFGGLAARTPCALRAVILPAVQSLRRAGGFEI